MSIKLIVATDEKYAIGYQNNLLFHITEDLKRFKKLTTGHIVVMGRKTYESLPNQLPNRLSVVLTKNKNYKAKESTTIVEHDISKIVKHYLHSGKQDKDLYVIGGAEIYKAFLPYADEILLTKIHKQADKVDTYLPDNVIQAIEHDWIFYSTENTYDENEDCYLEFNVYKRGDELL